MKYTGVFLLTFVLSISALGQVTKNDLLLGTWEQDERTPSVIIEGLNDSLEKVESLLMFERNGKVTISMAGEAFKYDYKLTENHVYIGNIKYLIVKLNKDDLILEKVGGLSDVDSYKRSNKKVPSVEESELVSQKYANGKMKLSGQKVNGFNNGIWIEWYVSGSVKRVTHYNLEVPFMDIEFDENGKVISKQYYDLATKGMIRE